MNNLRIFASFIFVTSFLNLNGYIGDDGLPHRRFFGAWARGYQETVQDFLDGRLDTLETALKLGDGQTFEAQYNPNDIDRRPWFIGYAIENNQVTVFLCIATKPDEHGKALKVASAFKFYCQDNAECPGKLEDHVYKLLSSHKEQALAMLVAMQEHDLSLKDLRFANHGDTLLHLAAQLSYAENASPEEIERLASFLHEVNRTAKNDSGKTALHYAVIHQNNPAVIRAFINQDAVAIGDNGGDTPLNIALMLKKDPTIIAALAEHSDVTQDNHAGINAEMFALIYQQEACSTDYTSQECMTAQQIKEIIARRAKAQFTLAQAQRLEQEKEALRKKLAQAKAEEDALLAQLAKQQKTTHSLEELLENK